MERLEHLRKREPLGNAKICHPEERRGIKLGHFRRCDTGYCFTYECSDAGKVASVSRLESKYLPRCESGANHTREVLDFFHAKAQSSPRSHNDRITSAPVTTLLFAMQRRVI